MRIYTRGGDDGTTGLLSGERVSKTDLRVEACGAIDELNSALGAARGATSWAAVRDDIERVQNQLFLLGASLASASRTHSAETARVGSPDILWLESRIDGMAAVLPELRNFILPGGAPAAAHLHLARAICRRAERHVVRLAQNAEIHRDALAYMNRLSDFLFTLARRENYLSGIHEEKWTIRER